MRYKQHLFVCTNTSSCARHNSEEIQKYLKGRLRELGLKADVRANKSGCLDACEHSPITVIYPEGIWYRLATEQDAELVLQQHIIGGKPVERLMVRELNPHYTFSESAAHSPKQPV